jgi:broad specificity phosphatase PhoE
MEVFVTRHGQTNWNILDKVQGHTDIELNEVGRQQAKETGLKIKDEKIDLIFTSPLKRAKETAEIINNNFKVPIIEDNRLMERSFGKNEGITKEDLKILIANNSEVNDLWNYSKKVDFNGIENMYDFCNRIYNFLDDTIKNYNDKNILIVTHGGASVPVKCYFTNYPLKNLVNRNDIKSLKNCEVIKFLI